MARSLIPILSLLSLSYVGTVSAFWRMECRGVLGNARIDPLANFGTTATHAHTLFGAQNIGFSSTPESIMSSNCTSCIVTEDKSSYWTPMLYFQADDGTVTEVENVGGMLAYYLLYGDNITAFPPGFAMISGDSNRRNFSLAVPDPPKSDWTGVDVTQDSLAQKAIGWNCLNYDINPEPSLYRHTMPNKTYMDANCIDGMRLELMFPSCWNGKDADSANHKDHMAFPDLVMTGTCPDGFDTRVPSIFYETIWNTYAFKDQAGQFVLANGDPTGTGYHGDFMAGWEPAFLQSAINTCTSATGKVEDCSLFTLQSDSVAGECLADIPSVIASEDVLGPRQGLPGGVEISYGPAPAAAAEAGASAGASESVATTPGTSVQSVAPYTTPTTTFTDAYGGGIFVAVPSTTLSTSPSTTVASSSAPPTTSSPSTTPSPTSPAEKTLYTSIYTTNGEEVHLVMLEDDVTVTVPTTSTVSVTARHEKRQHIHRHLKGRKNL